MPGVSIPDSGATSHTARMLNCAGRRLALDRPLVMGILNVTPDSFSDGGDFFLPAAAIARAQELVAEGAAIIDVGGESTRPDAAPVPVDEELSRVIPVIERLHALLPHTVISIDTSKPDVMRAAAAAGASMINDICALRTAGAMAAAAETGLPVCLMHMQGEPRSMQRDPQYTDVVAEVYTFLSERVNACVDAGIPRENLLIDPGFGFGKTLEHNLQLLRHLDEFLSLEIPLLVGLSRKSMIGALLGRPVNQRLCASIALATVAAWQGADIVRAHDVGETVEALRICHAAKSGTYPLS